MPRSFLRNQTLRGLGPTTAQLSQFRRRWEGMAKAAQSASHGATQSRHAPGPSRLKPLDAFGKNPGNLLAFAYAPENLPAGAPLVVVLHGCTQDAAGYDAGSGWSTLADRHGFAVLYPQQQAANNPNTCFNWFQPGNIRRGRGEALSIRQMVETMVERHGIDRSRVFVTGLSAGGAMTAAMLATYPDVFAAGAIIAGLPYGCAGNVQEALDSMFQGRERSASEWGEKVRSASSHRGPWPRVSVWHGSADATVKPMNADESVKQWANVHGLDAKPTLRDTVDGFPRAAWVRDGETVLESYTITGMAHGTPLGFTEGTEAVGAAGPYLLDVGISSSERIAAFFGLADAAGPARKAAPAREPAAPAQPKAALPGGLHGEILPPLGGDEPDTQDAPSHAGGIDVQAVIRNALRSAGLLKDDKR